MSSRLSRLLGHFCRRTADLRFLPSRLAFALTVRSAGFNAAATTAVAACGVFFPVRALDAIRIVSVCAAIVPALAAATFSDTIRFNSAPSLDAVPAAKRIGHRHHSVMLVSRTAAPNSVANWSGVCRCAMWVKPSSGMFVPYGGDAGASSYFLSLNFAAGHPGEVTKPLGARLLAIPVHATWVASFHVRESATLREFTSRFDPLGNVAASPSRAATSSSHSSAVKCSSCKIQPLWGNHDRNRLTARNGREEPWGDKVRRSAYDDRDLESFAFRIRLGFGRLNGAYWIRRGERAFEAIPMIFRRIDSAIILKRPSQNPEVPNISKSWRWRYPRIGRRAAMSGEFSRGKNAAVITFAR